MLLRHSALYLVARGVPALINFFAIALYTRLLTPDQYGQYALVVAWVSLGNAVFFQWLRLGLLRFLPAFEKQREKLLSTVAVGFAALVLISGLLSFGWWKLLGSRDQVLLAAGVVLLWLQAWYELQLEMARAELKPIRYGLMSLVKSALGLILGGRLALHGLGAAGVLVGVTISNLVPVLWALFVNGTVVRFRLVDWTLMLELVRYGLPLTVTFALGYIVSTSDRLLLGWLRGTDEAGLYAVGYDLAQSTSGVLMLVVNLAGYPIVVKALESDGVDAARRELSKNVTTLLAIAVPAAAGLMLLATNIADIFVGEEFRAQAGSIIPWIALGALLNGVKAYYVDIGFQLGKRTVGQIWSVLGAALTNLLLNLALIPQRGFMGAAYATVVAYGVGLLLSWNLSRRVFPLPFPVTDALKIMAATVGMVLTLSPVTRFSGLWALAIQVALGTLGYGVLLLSLNVAGVRSLLRVAIQRRKQ